MCPISTLLSCKWWIQVSLDFLCLHRLILMLLNILKDLLVQSLQSLFNKLNVLLRRNREKAAILAGTSFNSVSKIDNIARYEWMKNWICLSRSRPCQLSYAQSHHNSPFFVNIIRLLFPLTFLLFNLLYWTHYAGKGMDQVQNGS